MRFKNRPQFSGAGRTRAWHHHGSHTPTSPGTFLLGKMAYHTKQILRQCTYLPKDLMSYVNAPQEKLEEVHYEQATADFYYLSELIKDYIGLVGAVKDVFAVSILYFPKICTTIKIVETARTRTPLLPFFDHFWPFIDNRLYIFDRTEIQTVILRC